MAAKNRPIVADILDTSIFTKANETNVKIKAKMIPTKYFLKVGLNVYIFCR
jgi:hypothetical protein